MYPSIRNVPQDELANLIEDWQTTGSVESRNLAIQSCIPVVIAYVLNRFSKFKDKDQDIIDSCIQEGLEGLFNAADKFKPGSQSFRTYAKYWTRRNVDRYLRDRSGPAVYTKTRNGREFYYQYEKTVLELEKDNKPVNDSTLSKSMKIPRDEIARLRSMVKTPLLPEEANLPVWVDTLEVVHRKDLNEKMSSLIASFGEGLTSPRDVYIWDNMLIAEEPATQVAVSQEFGVSKQRVAQLRNRIKKSLRTHILESEYSDAVEYI